MIINFATLCHVYDCGTSGGWVTNFQTDPLELILVIVNFTTTNDRVYECYVNDIDKLNDGVILACSFDNNNDNLTCSLNFEDGNFHDC